MLNAAPHHGFSRVADIRFMFFLRALAFDQSQQGGMRLVVSGDDKTASAGVDRLPFNPGHYAAGRLAEGDTGRKVDAVTEMTVGDVGGAAAGSDPGYGQGGGDHAGPELLYEPRAGQHPGGGEDIAVGKGRVEIEVDQRRLG
jgi:hypothetical protein